MDNKIERVKLNASITQPQMDFLDSHSEKLGINRSALVSMCIQNYIDAVAVKESFKDINGLMSQVNDMMRALEQKDNSLPK